MTATASNTSAAAPTATDSGSTFGVILKAHLAAEAALAAAQSDLIPDRAFDHMNDYANEVRDQLLRTPAGSLSDLIAKLSVLDQHAKAHEFDPLGDSGDAAVAATIRADMVRLFPAN